MKDGKTNKCKDCKNHRRQQVRHSNRFAYQLAHSRGSARKRGLDFDLTEQYLRSIDRDTCPYLEIPIKWYPSKSGTHIDTKSLDRIDSNKGYVEGNVTFCSLGANQLLSNYTAEQLLAIPLLYRVGLNFMHLLNSTKPTDES